MCKLLKLIALTVLLSACTATSTKTTPQLTETVFYLTRHAEKEKSRSKDPLLSEQGQARAQALAALLQPIPLQKVYATKYQRTQLTAKPTAELKQLDVEISSLPAELLAAKLIKLHQGESVLVVGHSNTIPKLLSALNVKQNIVIDHQQYGDLYIVKVNNQGQIELKIEQFGEVN